MPTGTPTAPIDEGGSGTTGGTSGLPAMPPGHASPRFGIVLWNAGNAGYRLLPPDVIVPNVNARITASEGYGEGSFSVWGSLSDALLVGLVPRRRVEFWAMYADDAGTLWQERLYSGYIKRTFPERQGDGRQSIAVKLYSVWADAADCPTQKRYVPKPEDKNNQFGDLARMFVQTRYPNLTIDNQPVGQASNALNAYDSTFGGAVSSLTQNTATIVTGGARLSPAFDAPDCIYFRPVESAAVPLAHVIDFSRRQVGTKGVEEDDTKRATELKINGGSLDVDQGANILVQALNGGSTSFEEPIIPGAEGAGNLAQNPSFENGDKTNPTSWALQSGGSIKEQTDEGIAAFSGNRYLELDAVGEAAFQLLIPEETLVIGAGYVLDCRARRENASFSVTGELRYQWRNSSGTYFGPVYALAITPGSSAWDLFGGTVIPPTGAVALSIRPYCTATSGGTTGLLIDEIRFFNASAVQQKGWEAISDQANGALFNVIRWDDDVSPFHAGRCVYVDVVAADADNQNARIRPTNLARFPVAGGAHLVCGAFVKLAPGSPSVIVRPELYEWYGGEQYKGKTETGQITLSSTSWTLITTDRQYQPNAEEGSFAVQFRGTGQVYVDACFVMQYGATLPDPAKPEQFIEADRFTTTLFARDLFSAGNPPYQAYLDVGNVPEIEEREEITNGADATAYALDFFKRFAIPIDRPTVETFGVMSTERGTTASMWPGEMVRGIGADAFNVLPSPKPLMEKEIKWSAENGGAPKLTITLSCNAMKRDLTRTLADITRKTIRETGSESSYVISVGRGITGSGTSGVDDSGP